MPRQAGREDARDEGAERGQRNPDKGRGPERKAEMFDGQRDTVGAHAEIERLAEGQKTGIAEQQVDAGREQAPDHDLGHDADPELVCHPGQDIGRGEEEQGARQTEHMNRLKVFRRFHHFLMSRMPRRISPHRPSGA